MLTRRETWSKLHKSLDIMPVKRLMAGDFYPDGFDGCGCAVGELARLVSPELARHSANTDDSLIDVLTSLGFNESLLGYIMQQNDKYSYCETTAERWTRMHALAARSMEED